VVGVGIPELANARGSKRCRILNSAVGTGDIGCRAGRGRQYLRRALRGDGRSRGAACYLASRLQRRSLRSQMQLRVLLLARSVGIADRADGRGLLIARIENGVRIGGA